MSRLADDVEALISAYTPELIGASAWEPHQQMIRDQVRAARPDTPKRASQMLTASAALVGFAIREQLDIDTLFSEEIIGFFVARQAETMSNASRTTYRSVLRALTGYPPSGSAGAGETIGRNAPKPPYTPPQIERLLQIADAQSTKDRRQRIRNVICLAGGAGCNTGEILALEGPQVKRLDSGAVVCNIVEPEPRTVVVARRFEDDVWNAAVRAGTGLVVGVHRGGDHNVLNTLLRKNVRAAGADERIDIGRLRMTWLVNLVNSGADLNMILSVSGLTALSSLDRYRPWFIRPVDHPVLALRDLLS